ncbi:MAG: biotin--[acetyl-CoA-carboxylase] ligase [Bacteroidales bacterium]|nr:biotin--[acetyl-CoA-carboxylase] ligase [Candidatus Sodaliphilus aphodohippi]
MPRYILLHSADSTNSYLRRVASTLPSGTVIHTPDQRQGRGQAGNSWESEPGMNATFSFLLKGSGVSPSSQFAISEATAMAIVDIMDNYGLKCAVKWPNDIYHGDKKLGGILIEHTLMGSTICHSVIGAGINVNQAVFKSDAPNPVSMAQITGETQDIETVMREVCSRIEELCATLPDGADSLHSRFMQRLYRADGKPHPFELPDGTRFMAVIDDVHPDGMLALRHSDDGEVRLYAFKQVSHVLEKSQPDDFSEEIF